MAGRSGYTREFKMAMIALVESGTPIAQVARENGLHPALVARWKREYRDNPEKAFQGNGSPYKDQARIAELERMVGKLYAENEFLKKTLEKVNMTSQERRERSRCGRDTK